MAVVVVNTVLTHSFFRVEYIEVDSNQNRSTRHYFEAAAVHMRVP